MSKKYNYIRKTFTFNGRRYEVSGKTEAEAITKMVRLQDDLRRGVVSSGGNMTVNAWFEQWLELYKSSADLTPKSLAMYREKYSGYLAPAIGRMRLKDVRDVHLQRILNEQAGMSHSHVSKLRSVMQQMFSRARKSRLIPYDPAEDLAMPSVVRNSRRSLTPEEREVFLAVEPSIPGAVFYFAMLYTGMRPGELAALQWRDVDFDRNDIHVFRALESGSWRVLKEPKTAAGVRSIPIRAELAARLLPLRGEPMSPVFQNQAGNMHNPGTLQRLWNAITRSMDSFLVSSGSGSLSPDLVPYCLRHTFCTDLQDSGVPINIAKELMGHADISTTANIYTHRNQDTLHSYVSLMDISRTKISHSIATDSDTCVGNAVGN